MNVVGVEHVGLGSDYDGGVTVPFATDELVQLTQALVNDGFSKEQIEWIMGKSVLRLLLNHLPTNKSV